MLEFAGQFEFEKGDKAAEHEPAEELLEFIASCIVQVVPDTDDETKCTEVLE